MSKKIYIVTKIRRFIPDIKYILLWHKITGIEDEGQETFIKRKCPQTNCFLTTNRSLFGNLGYFDALIFNARDVSRSNRDLPSLRTSIQKYVFVATDSADKYPVCHSSYDPFFNWTWTYKLDSTIPYTYFTIYNRNDEQLSGVAGGFKWITNMTRIDANLKSQLSSKSKAAAIFLNECRSRSNRENYIRNLSKELSKYKLAVDIFGNCGTKKCKKKTMAGCFWRLKHQYYFYLAMEDSFSRDYVTREVFYAYDNYAVPIVYGGAEYNSLLPPNSYLNAMNLTEELLAAKIDQIIKNYSLYHDFFRWRNHYIIRSGKGLDSLRFM
ncbi:hypothetical protein ACJJTC_010493 [Scirpophaga incertulas]